MSFYLYFAVMSAHLDVYLIWLHIVVNVLDRNLIRHFCKYADWKQKQQQHTQKQCIRTPTFQMQPHLYAPFLQYEYECINMNVNCE